MKIKIKPKSKYLHIENVDGELYIYFDDEKWPEHDLVTKEYCDAECLMDSDRVSFKIRDLFFVEVDK